MRSCHYLPEFFQNFLGTFLGATPALAGDLGDWSAEQRQKHVDELPLRLFLRHPRGPLHQGELKTSWKRAENELWLMIGWSELIQCLSCEFLLVISRTTNQGVHLVNHTTLAFKISSISLKNLKDDDKDLSVPYGQDKMDRTRCCRPTQHVMRCVVMNCGGHFACRASTSLSWKRAMHCWWS